MDLVIPILVRKEARNGIVDKTTDVITADKTIVDKTIVDKTIVDKIIVDKIIEGITDDKIDGGKATVNLAAIVQIIETAVDEAIAKSICISAGVMIDNCFFFFFSPITMDGSVHSVANIKYSRVFQCSVEPVEIVVECQRHEHNGPCSISTSG